MRIKCNICGEIDTTFKLSMVSCNQHAGSVAFICNSCAVNFNLETNCACVHCGGYYNLHAVTGKSGTSFVSVQLICEMCLKNVIKEDSSNET